MIERKMSSDPGPRFCPGCGLAEGGDLEGSLCPECGETLVPQGYCPVCESLWRLPPEVPCPKHDVLARARTSGPLQAAHPVTWSPGSPSRSFPRAWPRRFRQPARSRGNPHVHRRRTDGKRGDVPYWPPRHELQVPADRVADARIILSQSWSLPDDEKADFEDLL